MSTPKNIDFAVALEAVEKIDAGSGVNPWAVSDASAFLNYCCPECEFQCKKMDDFAGHALGFHIRAKMLFVPLQPKPKSQLTKWSKISAFGTQTTQADGCMKTAAKMPESSSVDEEIYGMKREEKEDWINKILEKDHNLPSNSSQYMGTSRKNGPSRFTKPRNAPKVSLGVIVNTKEITEIEWLNHTEKSAPTIETMNAQFCASIDLPMDSLDDNIVETPTIHLPEMVLDDDMNSMPQLEEQEEVVSHSPVRLSEAVSKPPKAIITIDGSMTKYKCSECPSVLFDKKFEVLSHLISEHQRVISPLFEICQYCVEMFTNIKTLARHFIQSHPQIPMTTYSCKHCDDFQVSSIGKLREHSEKTHSHAHAMPYLCGRCPKEFYMYEELLSHEMKEHNCAHESFKCPKCSMVFHSKKNFAVHQYIHGILTDVPQFCSNCDFLATTKKELAIHFIEDHYEMKPPFVKCDTCDFIHEFPKAVEDHSIREHGKEYFAFNCIKCAFKTKYHPQFQMHIKSHVESVSVQCDECGNKFARLKNLQHHKECYHPTPGRENLICEHCGYSAKTTQHLKSHKYRTHEVEKHKPCPHCDYKSYSTMKVKYHIDNKHPETGTKQFFCEKCGKGFIYEESYKQHPFKCLKSDYAKNYRKEYEKKGRPLKAYNKKNSQRNKLDLPCDYCLEVFTDVPLFRKHYRDYHEDLPILAKKVKKPYPCPQCNDIFFTKHTLEVHLLNVHKIRNEKKKYCSECNQQYTETHNCTRNVTCELCDVTFPRNDSLLHHIKQVHDKGEEFECEDCGKKYATERRLNTHHINMHQPVRCNVCLQEISNAFLLKRHKAAAHGVIPANAFECQYCDMFFMCKKNLEKHEEKKHND